MITVKHFVRNAEKVNNTSDCHLNDGSSTFIEQVENSSVPNLEVSHGDIEFHDTDISLSDTDIIEDDKSDSTSSYSSDETRNYSIYWRWIYEKQYI